MRNAGCFKGNRDCIYPPSRLPGKVRSKSSTGLDRSRPRSRRSARRTDSSSREPSEPLPPSPVRDPMFSELMRQDPTMTTDCTEAVFFGPPPNPLNSQLAPGSVLSGGHEGITPEYCNTIDPLANYPKASTLPDDLHFFLSYYLKNLSHRNFFQRYHTQAFFHGLLIRHALDYQPLLYAVVAFSAYFYCCSQSNEHPSVFLAYYQESLSQLRSSLTSVNAPQPHDSMLLTILMFSSLEVCVHQSRRLLRSPITHFSLLSYILLPSLSLAARSQKSKQMSGILGRHSQPDSPSARSASYADIPLHPRNSG